MWMAPSGAEGIRPVPAGRPRPSRLAAAAALLALLVIPAATALAQSPAPGEYDIKAVFLYNFTRYVEWPKEPGAEGFAIVVFGESDIVAPLREIAKKKSIGALSILVRTCLDPAQIGRPRILFIAKSEASKLDQILKAVGGADILTVCEAAGLARADGVAINFVLKEGAVKFEISEKALDKTRLKVGSQLLKLAILVDGQGGRQGP
jgi:hypothetical protein